MNVLIKQTSKKVVPIFVSISASNSKQINLFSKISNDFNKVRQQMDARCECAWSDEGGSLVSTTWCGSTVSFSSEQTSTLNLSVDKVSVLWDCSLNWKPPRPPSLRLCKESGYISFLFWRFNTNTRVLQHRRTAGKHTLDYVPGLGSIISCDQYIHDFFSFWNPSHSEGKSPQVHTLRFMIYIQRSFHSISD